LATREGFVSVSFCYLVLRRLLQLVGLRVRSNERNELEIVVLPHYSRSISSRWRPSGCNGCTCSFFIELGSRRVHVTGCTPKPSAPWVTQQARHLTWTLSERPESVRFLIRDRDQKFTASFDEVFRGDGIHIIRTPFRAPQANGVAGGSCAPFARSASTGC
jgi:hypothetical protein